MFERYKTRKSGIELLRIIAVFLIILSHIVQTVGKLNSYGPSDYMVDIYSATRNVDTILLAIFRHAGHFGTTIFFLSSAYFLVDSEKWNNKKVIRIWFEMILVSLSFYITYIIIRKGNIDSDLTLRAFLPLFSAPTWYMSYYVIIALLSPLLNRIFKRINKYIVLGIGLALIIAGAFTHTWYAQAFSFPGFYCLVYFLKHNRIKVFENVWLNIILILLGFGIFFAVIFITNKVGLNNPDIVVNLTWQTYYGNIPFYLAAFGFVNLFSKMKMKNGFINFVAGLALMAYLIHENILFRNFTRPDIWLWLYRSFGSTNVALQAIIYALCLFVASILVAVIYKLLLQKWIYKLADLVSGLINKALTKPREKLYKKIQAN